MPDGIALNVQSPGSGAADARRAGNLKDAAGKFEALLIAQMLKSARNTDSGGSDGEKRPADRPTLDLAEQHLAELLGSQGGLGLARMVVKQLSPKE